jgi:hypothetical protein
MYTTVGAGSEGAKAIAHLHVPARVKQVGRACGNASDSFWLSSCLS